MQILILDIAVVILLLLFISAGYRRGLLHSAADVIGLILGFVGGKLFANVAAPALGRITLMPMMNSMAAQIDYSAWAGGDAAGSQLGEELVTGVLNQLGGASDAVGQFIHAVQDTLPLDVSQFFTAVVEKIAWMECFVIGFLVIQASVFVALRLLNKMIMLPVVGLPNSLSGAGLGLLKGLILVGFGLWIATLLPSLTEAGKLLSAPSLAQSWAAAPLLGVLRRLMPV